MAAYWHRRKAIWVVLLYVLFGDTGLAQAQTARELILPGAASPILVLVKPIKLPDVKFITLAGTPASISTLQGSYVLLNVWATWCGPCVKELPALNRLGASINRGFNVVAISQDSGGRLAVLPFLEKIQHSQLQIFIDSRAELTKTLRTVGLPITILVSPKGEEIARLIGLAEWDHEQTIKTIGKIIENHRSP